MFLCVFSEIKSCLIAALIFLLQMRGIFFVSAPFSLIYFGVILFLVYFDLVAEIIGMHDPFSPFETIVHTVLFSSWRKASTTPTDSADTDSHEKTD